MKVRTRPLVGNGSALSDSAPSRPRALFLSHGSPIYLVEKHPVTRVWSQIGQRIGQDFEAVIVISAHGQGAPTLYGGGPVTRLAYDFYGFPADCYTRTWSPPGNSALARSLCAEMSRATGQTVASRYDGPLDHGVWLPLSFLWPDPSCPVFSLGLPPAQDPAEWWRWGERLKPLSERPYLWIGSGGLVHNLGALERDQHDPEGTRWARQFADWVVEAAVRSDWDALVHPDRGPHAARALPTLEHYGPLLTIGALIRPDRLVPYYQAFDYGSLGLHILIEELAQGWLAALPSATPGAVRHAS